MAYSKLYCAGVIPKPSTQPCVLLCPLLLWWVPLGQVKFCTSHRGCIRQQSQLKTHLPFNEVRFLPTTFLFLYSVLTFVARNERTWVFSHKASPCQGLNHMVLESHHTYKPSDLLWQNCLRLRGKSTLRTKCSHCRHWS